MDNIDKKLVSILQEDGRTSLSAIGEELGMSHVAVSKRLSKLVEQDLVRVTAGVNGEAMDMKVLFIGIETENMDVADRILEKYASCPRVIMLAPVTGRYNLFAVMVAEDTYSLESILGTCSMRAEEGVRRSESWFGNSPVIPQFIPINLAPNGSSKSAPCGMACSECRRYEMEKCIGCPSTKSYKGTLWVSPLTEARKSSSKKKKSKS